MIKVNISTYGSVNKEVGWHFKEVTIEQAKMTVENVLKSMELGDGRTLFDLVGEEGKIKSSYIILLNGRPLWDSEGLKIEITSGDLVTAMDVIEVMGGG